MAKILLIEDDKVLVNVLRVKLSKAGHDVQMAGNGQEGLELMKSFHPDVVLMDLMMPVMDGFTALTQAKGDESTKNIPVIILTNLSQTEDAQKILQMGAKEVIVKSNLTPAQILEKISKYLPA